MNHKCPVCGNVELCGELANYFIPGEGGTYTYHRCRKTECGYRWKTKNEDSEVSVISGRIVMRKTSDKKAKA